MRKLTKHAKARRKLRMPEVPEKIARPTRTGGFIAAAAWIVGWYSAHVDHLTRSEAIHWTGYVAVALNLLWVAAEDYLERGLLRAVPPKDVPVADVKAPDGEDPPVAEQEPEQDPHPPQA